MTVESGVNFLDGNELKQLVRERFGNREWWVFLAPDERGAEMLDQIERKYYWGKKNADYEIVLGRDPEMGQIPLVFAKKTRMSKTQLAQHLYSAKNLELTAEEMGDRDVICPRVNLDEQQHVFLNVQYWLYGKDH